MATFFPIPFEIPPLKSLDRDESALGTCGELERSPSVSGKIDGDDVNGARQFADDVCPSLHRLGKPVNH